jgi:hypothetical protein
MPTGSRTSIAISVPGVQHQDAAVGRTHQKVWRVPPLLAFLAGPQQPKRLRHHRDHRRVEVQRDQMIPLDPRLVSHQPTNRGRPVPAREVALPSVRRERPHRPLQLIDDLRHPRPRHPPLQTIAIDIHGLEISTLADHRHIIRHIS